MKVVGAILAGGKSTRFGSDKAMADVDGRPMIAHVADAIAAQCDIVIVVGRELDGHICIEDRPAPDMGPLAGLAGALAYAADNGFDAVLSVGVDAIGLPHDLRIKLEPGPAYLVNQPVIGLWPVSTLATLDAILASDERHSMLHCIERVRARAIVFDNPPANINTRTDLEKLGQIL